MNAQQEVEAPRSVVSNSVVGKALGVHFTTASRIRSGSRVPSVPLMLKIEKVFEWELHEQAHAIVACTYDEEFEAALVRRFG